MPFFLLPALVLSEELVMVVVGTIALAGAANAVDNMTTDRRTTMDYYHHSGLGYGNSSSSSLSSSTTTYVEKKSIYDWWCNGLTGEEKDLLLENGYDDRSDCFTLEELFDALDRIFHTKLPGKPTEKDGFIPKKGWNGKTVKAPNSKRWSPW